MNEQISSILMRLKNHSFKEVIFFVPGFGLGDIIYCNRLLLKLKEGNPHAHFFVFSSRTWKDVNIALSSDMDVIWVPEINEFADRSKWSKLQAKKLGAYCDKFRIIVWDSINLPDRYAKNETVLETMCRGLEIDLTSMERKGVALVSKEVNEQALEFLSSHGLNPGEYIVIAPQTGLHKKWGDRNYSDLGERILKELGLVSVIVGTKSDTVPIIPNAVEALSLPLDLVSSIISNAVFFIGNDSGITHLAGCSEIPVYQIFSKARREAILEWRTQGPFVRYFVEPMLDESGDITVDTVFEMMLLDHKYFLNKKEIIKHTCFACASPIEFIIGFDERHIRFLCRCGNSYYISINKMSVSNSLLPPDAPILSVLNQGLNVQAVEMKSGEFSLVYKEVESSVASDNTGSDFTFKWSFDGLLFYLKGKGFIVTNFSEDGKKILFGKYHAESRPKLFLKQFQWAGKKRFVFSLSDYMNYFAWSTFWTEFRLTTIPKAIIEYEGSSARAIHSAIFIFFLYKNGKSFKILMKTFFRGVVTLLGFHQKSPQQGQGR